MARALIRPLAQPIDLLAVAAAYPNDFPCLLESTAPNQQTGRYDILFLHRGEVIQPGTGGAFLTALDQAWQKQHVPETESDLPFHGGWVLMLDYELAGECEPGLRIPHGSAPYALALRAPAAIIVDRVQARSTLVAESAEHLDFLTHAAAHHPVRPAPCEPPQPLQIEEENPQTFLDGVSRIHGHLRAGDVFQVNLSRAWRADWPAAADPLGLYRALRAHNPAPFSGFFRHAGRSVISSSPERLLEVRGARIQTRPIAGTRPRAREAQQDLALRAELIAHPKERAEHVMLIDLERNDLGRVCVPGSVAVDEFMVLESYAHVHHIVSNVHGLLHPHTTPGQIIRALFPGGTITGCPKVRCMQIIAELENAARGPYTGALGYLGRNGAMDLNILIRTLWLESGTLHWRTGSGIVVDSVATQELAETQAKARGLLRALGGTE